MKKRFSLIGAALLLLVVSAVVIFKMQDSAYTDQPYAKERVLLDALVTIKAYGSNGNQVEKAVNAAMEEIEKVDQTMDFYDPHSEISKVNKLASQRAGAKIETSEDIVSVIAASQGYYTKTGGAFDITLGPVMRLWNFNREPRVPSKKELQKALPLVNTENLEIDRGMNTVSFKKAGMQLDLGGVAKGYAVDKAVAVLEESGIKSALVTTGSSTTVIGGKPGGKPWQIGIRNPAKKHKTIGTLKLMNKSISTSGDYQQYFIKDGKRYHHILNPRTGLPARGCKSVTIVTSKSCTEADILSTAVFVMGYAQGLEFLKELGNTDAAVVDAKGKVHCSPGLRGKIKSTSRYAP